jgi:A/G-specific adenine glycosylase
MAPEELTTAKAANFRKRLLAWFDVHKRDLPWRRTDNPYKIWVSEIMLQQTRVAAVLEHYAEFLRRFPTIVDLANAPEPDVLAVWSGLGYYRRARMLHSGAKVVVSDHAGSLPRTSAQLSTLPGIGEYTSAAIASIAFGEAVAAVDGNVERVLTRVAGLAADGPVAKSSLRVGIQGIADHVLDRARPGDFNQAMMELGATVCLPRNPLCLQCPVAPQCFTRGEHPAFRRKPMISQNAAFALTVRSKSPQGTQVLLTQRPATASVMPGMWELPKISDDKFDSKGAEVSLRHAIMQTNYVVHVHAIEADALRRFRAARDEDRWFDLDALSSLPLTGLARKILRRVGLLAHKVAQPSV